jgi:dipeptidyl aminopeptidase/acylaminoacyl peptidase
LVDWHIDPDGNLIGQSTYDTKTHEWKLQVRRNGTWIDSYSVTALVDPPTVVTMTPDAKALVLQRVTEDQGLEFRRVSLEDGKLGELVPEYRDVKDVLYDPQTHRPIGGLKISLDHTYVFFDPKDRALWDGVVKLFPDEEVQMVSWSKDRGKVVVRVTGLNHGVSYYVVDTAAHKAVGIGNLIEGLGPKDLAGIAMVTYPAKDGLPIQALLTLPNGREPKNLPLIVLPHAGPVASDEVGYNGTAQALASRGYAVLQPEFRGSNGLGWKLESAGFGEWGRKMQTDLSDGVRALASKGYIDPKRVCIVGAQGGYSGYAALAGVMFEHDVYRCAVAVNPWTDIRKLAGGIHADTKGSINVRNWERFIGAKDQRDPVFDQISPSDHAAEASAPILIIHPWGSDDSVRMSEALQRAKKPVELVSLKTNDNKATGEALSLQALQATVAFLEKNNPPN